MTVEREEGGTRRIASLAGLRGVAALWVLLFHADRIACDHGRVAMLPLIGNGWAGVDLFFILSGFVIANAYADRIGEHGGIARFARGRFWRIYPTNLAVLVFILALVTLDPPFHQWFAERSPGNLGYRALVSTMLLTTQILPVQGDWNQPVWSLSVELVGYAMFPLLAASLRQVTSVRHAMVSASVALVAMIGVEVATGGFGRNLLDPGTTLVRLAGCFVAGTCLQRGRALLGDRGTAFAPPLALAGVVAVVVLDRLPRGGSAMCVPFCALVFALSYDRGRVSGLLRGRFCRFLGDISFPLYLLHVMPLLAFNMHMGAPKTHPDTVYVPLLALLCCTLVGCAWLGHVLIERPIARRVARRHRRATPAFASMAVDG